MGEWDEKRVWTALWTWMMDEGVDDALLCEKEGQRGVVVTAGNRWRRWCGRVAARPSNAAPDRDVLRRDMLRGDPWIKGTGFFF